MNHQDYKIALHLIDSLIKSDPKDAECYEMKGEALHAMGKTDDAIDSFNMMAKLDQCDTCSAAHDSLGYLNLEKKDYEEAKTEFLIAMQRGSKDAKERMADFLVVEGDDLLNDGKFPEAGASFEKAASLSSDTSIFRRLLFDYVMCSDTARLVSLAESLVQQYPSFEAPHCFLSLVFQDRGEAALGKNDFSGGIRNFTRALENGPGSAGVYFLLGYAYDKTADTVSAIRCYKHAIALGITYSQPYINLARFSLAAGNFVDGRTLVQKALGYDKTNTSGWILLSTIYGQMKDSVMAVESYRRAARLGCVECQRKLLKQGIDFLSVSSVDDKTLYPWLALSGADLYAGTASSAEKQLYFQYPADTILANVLPVLLGKGVPEFSEHARSMELEGTVWVNMLIDTEGDVAMCKIIKSDASVFDLTAYNVAVQMRFKPATAHGVPVKIWITIPLRFWIPPDNGLGGYASSADAFPKEQILSYSIVPFNKGADRHASDLPFDREVYPLLHKVKLYGGVTVPRGSFGSSDPASASSGFVLPGFSAGIEYTYEVLRGCGFVLGETFSYHGVDKDGWRKAFHYFDFDAEDRWLLWTTGGILGDLDISPSLNICITLQTGFLYTNYPKISVRDVYGNKATISAPAVINWGHKIGGGVRIGRYELGVHYLTSDSEFHPEYKDSQGTIPFSVEEKPVRAFQFTLGYLLN